MNLRPFVITYIVLTHVIVHYAPAQPVYQDPAGAMRETVTDPNIKTVQLYREGWPLSYPVIRLPADVPLVLEFDYMSKDITTFYYTLIHCDADWRQSTLFEQEYMETYMENEVPQGEPSFNTYQSYMHHRLMLPNEDLRMLVSGNYLLVVYRNRDREDVVLTRRFMVTEAAVSIDATARIPVLNRYKGCCQEVDFTVDHTGVTIDDPFTETTAAIYQNALWDLGITGIRPRMVRSPILEYDYNEENIFQGGNEFRFFDTKNTQIPSYYVERIDYIDPHFHFELKADKARPPHNYFSQEDINGRYAIESAGGRNPELDADYVFVHFQLDMPLPLEGNVYIAGALTNWEFNEQNRMEYHPAQGAYRKSLFLKQGVYNYRYLFLPTNAVQFDIDAIEGSHSETENEYLILFYHRPPGGRYDRLLGHQVVHSGMH